MLSAAFKPLRRPADRYLESSFLGAGRMPEERPFEERTIQVAKTLEKPVVSKVVKVGGEVAVRKGDHDHRHGSRPRPRNNV